MNGNSEHIPRRFCRAAVLRMLRGQRASQIDKILAEEIPCRFCRSAVLSMLQGTLQFRFGLSGHKLYTQSPWRNLINIDAKGFKCLE
jgi:hypothetical protein